MRRMRLRARLIRFAASAGGSALLLSGCDPTIQTTVENGIINVSTAFLSSFLQALLQVGAAQAGA